MAISEHQRAINRRRLWRDWGGVLKFPLMRVDGRPVKPLDWSKALHEAPSPCVDTAVLTIDFRREEIHVDGGVLTFRELKGIVDELHQYHEDF